MRTALAVILLALTALPVAAQTKRPMTFQDMMQMRRLGSTDVSPDGKWLLYSVTDVDLSKDSKTNTLWLQAIAGGEAKRVEGTEPGDGSARFSHDGKRLLFLSSRAGSQQIWVADFDSSSGATTNAKPQGKSFDLDADNALWSPDGKTIVFTAQVYPDCPAIAPEHPDAAKCTLDRDTTQATSKVKARIFDHLLYKHWNAFTGDKRSHLFELTVDTGSIRDLTPNDTHDVPPFSLGGDGGFAFSPDSKELAFTENLDEEPAISTNADIFTLDLTNPAAKPIKISTSPGGDLSPAYSPDGKYLAWRSQARAGYESDKFRLALHDRATKLTKDLLPNFDRWVDEFAWGASSKQIFFTSGVEGEEDIYDLGLWSPGLEPGLIADGGEFSGLNLITRKNRPTDVERDGVGAIVVTMMKANLPAEAVIVQIGDTVHEPVRQSDIRSQIDSGIYPITHLNQKLLAQIEQVPLVSFWFPAADGTKVQGFLIRPPAFDPNKKYPVKFLIHGGPQGAWGDAWSYRWNAELFAANGYVVIMINPRGSTGYGQAFVDGVNGDWGGKPFTDLMLGLDYAEKTYPFIDKNRECALGASYGGYMANWILGHTNRFKCIVTHDGMFNPESAYGSTEELWFNEWEFKAPNSSGGKPWDYYGRPDSENPYRKWSPALSAKNFKTPTLVIHSQLDYRLDVSESYQLFTTLQRLKVPSKMLYFPDEGHWVQKPQNSQLWYQTVNAWVDQWIGDSASEGKK